MAPEKKTPNNPNPAVWHPAVGYKMSQQTIRIKRSPDQIYEELEKKSNGRSFVLKDKIPVNCNARSYGLKNKIPVNCSVVQGIFLYTDEDMEMINYIEKNFQALDKLSGEWSEIYLLKKETTKDIGISKWLGNIILGSPSKPFNRNESYDIARKFNIPFDAFPCLIFLLCDETLFSYKKLIIPIKEVSVIYFRKLFTILEEIVNNSKAFNKYEELENNFDMILSYLEKKSSKVSAQTTTEYQIQGQTILFVNEFRSIDMSENNPIHISESNVGSVTGHGEINTAIINKYPPDQRQTLSEAAAEIQELLEQLSKTYPPTTPENNEKIAVEAIKKVENNPSLKSRIMNAIQLGSIETLKELVDHPAINIFFALVDGWKSAE